MAKESEPVKADRPDRAAGPGIERRTFLTGTMGSTVALAAASGQALAAPQEPSTSPTAPAAPEPWPRSSEFGEIDTQPELLVQHPTSDVMLDVIKTIGIEYIAANPGSSFRSLHESIVNYGDNKAPELLTCLHEESAVAIAAGS